PPRGVLSPLVCCRTVIFQKPTAERGERRLGTLARVAIAGAPGPRRRRRRHPWPWRQGGTVGRTLASPPPPPRRARGWGSPERGGRARRSPASAHASTVPGAVHRAPASASHVSSARRRDRTPPNRSSLPSTSRLGGPRRGAKGWGRPCAPSRTAAWRC